MKFDYFYSNETFWYRLEKSILSMPCLISYLFLINFNSYGDMSGSYLSIFLKKRIMWKILEKISQRTVRKQIILLTT